MTELERRRDIAAAVGDDLSGRDDVQAVLLVGSTATGHADEHSDVDLQVVGPDEPGEQSVDGVHVEWNPVTRDDVESNLDGWDDDVALYTYANADLLYDRADLASLFDRYAEYPADVRREKLYAGWFYGTGTPSTHGRPSNAGTRGRLGVLPSPPSSSSSLSPTC